MKRTALVLRILFWAIGLVVAFVLAISLAQPLSGFALDAIARKQELALGASGRVSLSSPARFARCASASPRSRSGCRS